MEARRHGAAREIGEDLASRGDRRLACLTGGIGLQPVADPERYLL